MTLYRKYRPQVFSEIVGQNHIKITLQNEVATSHLASAYLFCGPRAVGKTTMARVMAKAVNCQNRKEGEFEPCNKCSNCNSINTGSNMDVIEIDAASNTGVDNVRENIISLSRVSSSGNSYKVFIIDEVHMLSISAFNALLKTLEEPPRNVMFILCTTEIHKVPATIISRCQRFDFKRVSLNDMIKKLEYIVRSEGLEVEKEVLESVARQADGYLRDAESLLGQIAAISGQKITKAESDLIIPRSDFQEITTLLESLAKKDAVRGIKLINDLVDGGGNLKNFLDETAEALRKLMLGKVGAGLPESLGIDFGESGEKKLAEISASLSLTQIVRCIEVLTSASMEMKNYFLAQLPIEIAIVELCIAESIARPVSITPSIPASTSVSRETVIKKPLTSEEVKKPAPIAKAEVKSSTRANANFNLSPEAVNERWPEVLIKVKADNHSLSFILQACQISGIVAGILTLTVKYKFHKDRIDSLAIRTILEEALKDVYGEAVNIISKVDENLIVTIPEEIKSTPELLETDSQDADSAPTSDSGSAPAGNDMISDLLKTFGGQIVN